MKTWIKAVKGKDGQWTTTKCPITGEPVWFESGETVFDYDIQCNGGLNGTCAYAGNIHYSSPTKYSIPCHYPEVKHEGCWYPKKKPEPPPLRGIKLDGATLC